MVVDILHASRHHPSTLTALCDYTWMLLRSIVCLPSRCHPSRTLYARHPRRIAIAGVSRTGLLYAHPPHDGGYSCH